MHSLILNGRSCVHIDRSKEYESPYSMRRSGSFLVALGRLWILSALSAQIVDGVQQEWNGTTNIVGGQIARKGAYLSYAIPAGNLVCGATLIHPDILISAAHCQSLRDSFVSPDGFSLTQPRVYLGGSKIDGSDAAETIGVELERRNPDYKYGGIFSHANDFLLVKLASPSAAPIVKWNTDPVVPADGEVLKAIGFGETRSNGTLQLSADLREVQLAVVSFDTCNKAYGGGRVDDATMLCAAANGKDTCQGDSGGPLFSSDGTLVAIVSWGIGCADPKHPGVNARVSSADKFIRTGICEMSDSPPAYCADLKPTNTCDVCKGRLFTSGKLLHSKFFGNCVERCVTFGALALRLLGWSCGRCL